MSTLGGDDQDLHYSDGSHRWTGVDPSNDEEHRARVAAHIEEHRREPGSRGRSIPTRISTPRQRPRMRGAR
jgi:hypothetical protein